MNLRAVTGVIATAVSLAAVACGSSSPSSTAPTPVVTAPNYFTGMVMSADTLTFGSIDLTIDLPVSSLIASTGAAPQLQIPVPAAKLTLRTGVVVPLSGYYDSNTSKVYLRDSQLLYSIVLDLGNQLPDGTFTTPDGKVGGVNITRVATPTVSVIFCGSYFKPIGQGRLTFTASHGPNAYAGAINGYAIDGSDVVTFRGSSNFSGQMSFAFSILNGSGGGSGQILGSPTNAAASGLWSNSEGEGGIWGASVTLCF